MDQQKEPEEMRVMIGVTRRDGRDLITLNIGGVYHEMTPSYADMVVAQLDGVLSMFEEPEDEPLPGEDEPRLH